MLTRAQVTENDTLLITGASGGVGSAAIQLAKARGPRVIAVAGDKKQHSVVDAGADQALVRGDSLGAVLGENAVDVVIDLVGGVAWPELLNILRLFFVDMRATALLQDLLLRSTSEHSTRRISSLWVVQCWTRWFFHGS